MTSWKNTIIDGENRKCIGSKTDVFSLKEGHVYFVREPHDNMTYNLPYFLSQKFLIFLLSFKLFFPFLYISFLYLLIHFPSLFFIFAFFLVSLSCFLPFYFLFPSFFTFPFLFLTYVFLLLFLQPRHL